MAELPLRDPCRALAQVERRGIARAIPEEVDRTGRKDRPATRRRRRTSSLPLLAEVAAAGHGIVAVADLWADLAGLARVIALRRLAGERV
jgi:hypothetical protein